MIDLYMWTTTNSRRASLGLEEAGLPYTAHPVNINEKEQFTPEHTARNPYQKVPVIVDPDGPDGREVTIFESGAILLYAAEKSGTLYGKDAYDRVEVQKWFMFHMNGTLPIFGQLRQNADLVPNAERTCKVMEGHLADREFFAPDFSIADLAFYPRIANWSDEHFPISDYKNIARWKEAVGAREGVKRGWAQPKV